MSKINITFKGKKYAIDKSLLAGAMSSLEGALVELEQGGVVAGNATFDDGVTLTWDQLKLEENGDYYGYNASSISDISIDGFYNCSSIISITIPSSVTTIETAAFKNCYNLMNITIPDSVMEIGEEAFQGCYFTNIILPRNLTNISRYTFTDCSNLETIIIPDSVTSIGDSAFCGCSKLTSVVIPDGVTSIGDYAFSNCNILTSITYEGTVAEWNTIQNGENWNYMVPATYVQCSDGTVEL